MTFTNPDGSTGWKIKQQCSSDYGSIIGGIVGGIFGFALFLLIIRYYAENRKHNRKQKVEKCMREAHRLRQTHGVEFYLRGDKSYQYYWLCDNCNHQYTSTTSTPLLRCDKCELDYCARCNQGRESQSAAAAALAVHRSILQGGGRNTHTVVPHQEAVED